MIPAVIIRQDDHEDHGCAEFHRAFAYSRSLQRVSHRSPGITVCAGIIAR